MTKKELEKVLKNYEKIYDKVDDTHKLLKSGKLTLDTEKILKLEPVFSNKQL